MCVVEAVNAVTEFMDLNQQKIKGNYYTQQLINQGKESENNAAIVRQEGIEKARREKLNAILNMAKTKTNAASNNLALSSETVLNLEQDNLQEGKLNALNTLKSSERKAEQYINSANNYYQKAALNSYQTKMNYRKGMINFGTKTLLGGTSANMSNLSMIASLL